MAQKRPFDDEVVNEVSSKHPRQDAPSDEVIFCNGNLSEGDKFEKSNDSDDATVGKKESIFLEEHGNCSLHEVPRGNLEDIESGVFRSASLSHWATSSTSDDDEPAEEHLHFPFFPGYFSFDRPVRSVINPDDVYYCLLDYPPRKRVPVGPGHQADIPEWRGQGDENTKPKPRASEGIVNDDGKMDGICVMPCPVTEPPPYNGDKVGDGRTECSCPDEGSIRCVRQHIAEARDKLRRTLSPVAFAELGFYDMGEVVSENWSEEEEQLFHEVVYSNPASLGKNFWSALSAVFPCRSKMEIVSYYFNVFMLRKRAEQNRFDPMSIDSDNDEWHISDDDGGEVGGSSEEEDDSGVESPVRHDGLGFHQNGLHGPGYELEDDDDNDDDDDDVGGDISDEARETNDNNGSSDLIQKSEPDSSYEFRGKKSEDDGGDNVIQDGSCTSSDSGPPVQGAQLKPDGYQEWHHGYILESTDAKVWDGYDMSCTKSDVEFLPTCSMIEEVFGDVDIDSKGTNW